MDSFSRKLYSLNPESDWQAADLEQTQANHAVFERYCGRLFMLIREHFSGISEACLAVAGFECGWLTPVATLPTQLLARARKISRRDADAFHALTEEQMVLVSPDLQLYPIPNHDVATNRFPLVIKIIGNGEYVGLLWLNSPDRQYFTGTILNEIEAAVPILTRHLAEAVFSMRVQALAAPFTFRNRGRPTDQELFDHIVQLATLGFAADGSVLRIYDPQRDQLTTRAIWGNVVHEPSAPGSVGERICRAVFDSDQHYGTARTLPSRPDGKQFGASITHEDETALNSLGINAYMIMRLQSDIGLPERESQKGPRATGGLMIPKALLGTLAIFHYRPHEFSPRDIHLFRSYSERVADDLALLQQMHLLDDANLRLQTQTNMLTRAEIVRLLAHDLGHKAIHTTEAAKSFKRACTKALRDKRSPDYIDSESQKLIAACEAMEFELGKIRATMTKIEEEPVIFDVIEQFKTVQNILASALERNYMKMEIVASGNMLCSGPRDRFEQVVFNLVINSIDAQQSSRNPRNNVIHVHAREETQGERRRIIIQFWDEGPGVNGQYFPNPNEIFDIGTTSKPEGKGSGTGLPISRSMLWNCFKGELVLVRREGAHFEIRMPAPLPKRKLS